jgi:hypothetical protein
MRQGNEDTHQISEADHREMDACPSSPDANQVIRRGSFDSVTDLKRKISAFVEQYNQHPKPFMWTATAESILAKLEPLCKVINGTRH